MLAHLATSLFNRPLAIKPEKAELIMGVLADRLGLVGLRLPDGRMRAFDGDGIGDQRGAIERQAQAQSGYEVVAGGVAIISVAGTLVQRQLGLRPYSGMTGYNALRGNFFAALADPLVRAILFDIDSPGGDVAGLFDLADAIHAARGRKPIWAVLDEMAASAAYAIAAACDRVSVPRTGYTGSVGVIVLHCDLSKLLAKEGVTVTVLQYGERKADGHPEIALSGPAKAAMQADIDKVGDLFVASVARYRGIAPERVRAQQAAVFMGRAGVDAGLADVVASPAEAFAMLRQVLGREPPRRLAAGPRAASAPAATASGAGAGATARRRRGRLLGWDQVISLK